MNSLTIPPSPNWYEANILACAPDNTLIYGARNDLVILEKTSETNQAADVRIISRAHSQKVLGVCINKNWGNPKKLAVSVSDDKSVKIWDIKTGKKHAAHNKHLSDNKVIAATFAGEERVVSVSEDGNIVIWNIALNETTELKDVFGMKVMITCMSTCPHATWLTAFGLKSGLVIVTDLRKTGKVLYKMRGHDKAIISLSWCPVPINIFPKSPSNYVGQKKTEEETKAELSVSNDDAKEEMVVEEDNIKSDLQFETETHPLLKVYDSGDEDFLKECEILKNKILGTPEKISSPDDTGDISEEQLKQLIDKSILEKTGNSLFKKLEEIIENLNESQSNIYKENLNISKDGIDLKEENFEEDIKENTQQPERKESCINTIENGEDGKESDKIINVQKLGEEETLSRKTDVEIGSIEDLKSVEDINNKIQKSEEESIIETLLQKVEHENASQTIEIKDSGSVEVDTDFNQQKDELKKVTKFEKTSKTKSKRKIVKTYVDESQNDETSPTNQAVQVTKTKSPAKEEEPRKEFLLASSAKESNIYIWRAGTDGRMQTFISLTGKIYNRKNRSNVDKIWITLNWVTPTVLLSSSKDYELVAWNLPKPQDAMNSFYVIHKDHTSQLFSISAPSALYNEYNWKDGRTVGNAWTISQDRLLLNTSIGADRTNLSCYPTLGGHVECMLLSPLDPNRLAIGSADCFLKVWDLSRPHTKNIIMTNFYHKIQSKVSALAWHPTNELILAYGTVEGRVGYVDPNSKSKPSVLLSQFFKTQIYKLEWGPINGNKEKLGLYAIGEGSIVYFNIEDKTNRDPTVIATPEGTFIYSFGWKPDYSQLFVIARAGFIMIYNPQMKVICKHYFSYRINDIFWHPNAADSTSEYHNWLAVVGSTKNVFVYKFDIDSGNNDENIVNIYQSESEVINCVSWSPYVPSQMIVCCDMGIAQIWDAKSGEFLATFINTNYEPVTTAVWSPIDADFIISGGKDNTLKIWKISNYPPVDEKEIIVKRKVALKEISASKTNTVSNKVETDGEPVKDKKCNKNTLLPKFYSSKSNSIITDLRKLLQWKENPESVTASPGDFSSEILNVFGSDSSMMELVMANENTHKQKGKFGLNSILSLFRGDISTTIREAIEEKRVDRWIISMAPMVSPKLWQLACETYARQLSEEPGADVLEIATFYLASHKVQEAVDILCEGHMYREALALVKCRMLGQDVVSNVIEKWGEQAKIDGNFESAAQCFIYLGKYEEAASLLFRRSDMDILEFVVELSAKTKNEELHNAALVRYNLYKAEYDKVKNNEKELPSIQDAVLQKNICEENVNTDEHHNSSGISTESEEMYNTATSGSDLNITIPEDTSGLDSEGTSDCVTNIEANSQELIKEAKVDCRKESTENCTAVQHVDVETD